MANIVRMEDIIDIVGMQNYFKAIQLDNEKLKLINQEQKGKKVELTFQYDNKWTNSLTINQKLTLSDFVCNCKEYNYKDLCPHTALNIMYLLMHEEIAKEAVSILNSQYDELFNQYLFEQLQPSQAKQLVHLDINLKNNGNMTYELNIRIGEGQLYVLKQKLEEFVYHFDEEDYEITFGKNFTYRSNIHYFSKEDLEIIDFLKRYVESQGTNTRSYYYYTPRVTTVELSGSLLKEFLKLLKQRTFTIEFTYQKIPYQGIIPYHFTNTKIENKQDMVFVNFDYDTLIPLTEDYQYVYDNKKCYFVGSEEQKFLKLLFEHKKKSFIFKEKEYGKFANIILPKLKKMDENITIPEKMQEKIMMKPLALKYYFEKKKNSIVGEIKFQTEDQEINIFSDTEQINGKYIIRDKDQERIYQQELLQLGFQITPEQKLFNLDQEEQIIYFLEEGLGKLTEKYEVYVSKSLKDIHIYPKSAIKSSFGIGKDNILSYEFSIDQVDPKELQNLLDAVKIKKKYYRLKNGNYMKLDEDKELEKFQRLTEVLDLTGKDLLTKKGKLPKYRSIQLSSFQDQEDTEFIQFEQPVTDLINKFKQYRNTDIKLSLKDKRILRDYQEIGVKWMMTIANCGFGGILADEMGLGKSLQTIKYIELRLKQDKNAKFLIVVPTSLVYNWQKEFEKFAQDIKVLLVHDQKKKRMEKLNQAQEYDVLITSYGLLRQDLDFYQTINFNTCIIDEAQNIKNVQTEITRAVKEIRADVKFALTGTPIENSVLELWSIFDYIMPGFLPNITRFKREYSVKKLEEEPEILQTLNTTISPFILRRKKADVIKDLPPKLENTITIDLEEEQKKLYLAQLQQTKRTIDEAVSKEGFLKSQILILSLLTKLRQICIDPRLLIEEYQGGSAKIKQLIEILQSSIENGHKILVFSQFPSALQLLKPELEQAGITYHYLDGSTKSKVRMQLVEQFNQDQTNVFLISLKAGGTGLNLTSADIVIHLDPWWNPQVENQATDRAHRIGQKNVVEVVKLVAKGTIEEKIIELQQKKKKLSDQVIEGEGRDQIVLSKLTEKELRSLLDS